MIGRPDPHPDEKALISRQPLPETLPVMSGIHARGVLASCLFATNASVANASSKASTPR